MVPPCPFVSVLLLFIGHFLGTTLPVLCSPGKDVPSTPLQTRWGDGEMSLGRVWAATMGC